MVEHTTENRGVVGSIPTLAIAAHRRCRVRDIVHPGIREETGYVGYVVLGDSETGKALGVTLWLSEADRERSDEKARQIRPRVEQATGGTKQSVESYDVLFFDVRQS